MLEVLNVIKVVKGEEHDAQYEIVYGDVSRIIDVARESAVRSVNAAMTSAYWLIGHRIVEFEQSGEERAEYGTALLERLASDLTRQFGRGFSRQNLQHMRMFYLAYPPDQIRQILSGKLTRPPQLPNLPDAVWQIRRAIYRKLGRSAHSLPAAVVSLRQADVDRERTSPRLLRGRSPARRVVGTSAQPADQFPIL